MGKKGKRSKKKDDREKADKIMREYKKLICGALSNMAESLYSKGINQFREAIQLFESKKELMLYTRDRYLTTCYFLMVCEYQRHHYKEAIDYYNNFMTNSDHTDSNLRSIASLYYQLIMLRFSGQECQLSDFIRHITPNDDTETKVVGNVLIEAIFLFRAHKQFDSAIKLEMACGSSLHSSELKSKLSLALTYLEQHRLEFDKRLVMRKEDSRRIISLVQSLLTEYPPFEGDQDNYDSPEYFLVLAQWYYLSQTIVKEERSIVIALHIFKQFLSAVLMKDKGGEEIVQDNCYKCGQAITPAEVQ